MIRSRYTFSKMRRHSKEIRYKTTDIIDKNRIIIDKSFNEFDKFVASLENQEISLLRNANLILACKMLNHVYSAMMLAENGLMVDAILCERNAIETMAFYWLLCYDSSYAEKYNNGDIPKPVEVRKLLEKLGINVANLRNSYSITSQISHVSRESETFSSTWLSPNNWELNFGGRLNLIDQDELISTLPLLLGKYLTKGKKE